MKERIDASSPRPPLSDNASPSLRSKRFLTVTDFADIVTRYEEGETTQQIGTHYGVSKTRVATVLRDQGVAIRRQGLSDEQVRKAVMLYGAGQSLAQIGARFGVSHTTIAAALRKHDVQLRPRPGWR